MSAETDPEWDEIRAAWIRLVVEAGLSEALAERAYRCAHRVGRGAGRLEALALVRETGSTMAAADALSVLNEAELVLSEAGE